MLPKGLTVVLLLGFCAIARLCPMLALALEAFVAKTTVAKALFPFVEWPAVADWPVVWLGWFY